MAQKSIKEVFGLFVDWFFLKVSNNGKFCVTSIIINFSLELLYQEMSKDDCARNILKGFD